MARVRLSEMLSLSVSKHSHTLGTALSSHNIIRLETQGDRSCFSLRDSCWRIAINLSNVNHLAIFISHLVRRIERVTMTLRLEMSVSDVSIVDVVESGSSSASETSWL